MLRIGKYMELTVEKSDRDLDEVINDVCRSS